MGYTRKGVAFAAGESGPVCIVTEGRGTTQVTHKGKTYYVCCSGCKDLFNKDPEAVLAEAAERAEGEGEEVRSGTAGGPALDLATLPGHPATMPRRLARLDHPRAHRRPCPNPPRPDPLDAAGVLGAVDLLRPLGRQRRGGQVLHRRRRPARRSAARRSGSRSACRSSAWVCLRGGTGSGRVDRPAMAAARPPRRS